MSFRRLSLTIASWWSSLETSNEVNPFTASVLLILYDFLYSKITRMRLKKAATSQCNPNYLRYNLQERFQYVHKVSLRTALEEPN